MGRWPIFLLLKKSPKMGLLDVRRTRREFSGKACCAMFRATSAATLLILAQPNNFGPIS